MWGFRTSGPILKNLKNISLIIRIEMGNMCKTNRIGTRAKIALTFYMKSKKRIMFYESNEEGYIQYNIYDGPTFPKELGRYEIVRLSDGRQIAANELWCDLESWVKEPPLDALIGEFVQDGPVEKCYVY